MSNRVLQLSVDVQVSGRAQRPRAQSRGCCSFDDSNMLGGLSVLFFRKADHFASRSCLERVVMGAVCACQGGSCSIRSSWKGNGRCLILSKQAVCARASGSRFFKGWLERAMVPCRCLLRQIRLHQGMVGKGGGCTVCSCHGIY